MIVKVLINCRLPEPCPKRPFYTHSLASSVSHSHAAMTERVCLYRPIPSLYSCFKETNANMTQLLMLAKVSWSLSTDCSTLNYSCALWHLHTHIFLQLYQTDQFTGLLYAYTFSIWKYRNFKPNTIINNCRHVLWFVCFPVQNLPCCGFWVARV